jgi:hypothetical protein
MLGFDPATHRYTTDTGRELLSVTTALREAGVIDPTWFTEDAAIRGTYVHQAIALDHEGDLDDESLDPLIAPYVCAYRRFREESGFVEAAWEEQVADEDLGVAGTLDLRGAFPRRALRHPGIDLLDIKTGTVPSWVGYQTAAYARLLPSTLGPLRWRWCLQLCPDGSYRLHECSKPHDERVFLAALTIAQAKRGWL